MKENGDWRLTDQEEYLKGVTLISTTYRQYKKNPNWDHDHCAFCWTEFCLKECPDSIQYGYTTQDEYYWICPQCFQDFKDKFQWKVVEAEKHNKQINQGDMK